MKSHATTQPGYSPRPLIIYLQPGQELRIIGTDSAGNVPAGVAQLIGTPRADAVPSRSSDTSVTPSRPSDRASRH